MNPENKKNIIKGEKYDKIGGESNLKILKLRSDISNEILD